MIKKKEKCKIKAITNKKKKAEEEEEEEYIRLYNIAEGSLEVKLPTIWTDEKAEVGRVREDQRREEKRSERRERVRRKKMQAREKVDKSPITVFYQ